MYNVLIAEPDQTMALVLSRIIHLFDNYAEIICANTDEDLYQIGRQKNIDILFLNLSTHSQLLIEAGEMLQEIKPDLYICIMSVFDASYFGKELFGLRYNGYLTKPFSSNEVIKLLREFRLQTNYKPVAAARKMISCIEQKDFFGAYERSMSVILKSAGRAKNDSYLQKDLMQLADYIMNLFLSMNTLSADRDKYNLNIQWCKDHELLKIWFFNVIEYVFQKVSIINCGILERFFDYIEENKYNHISLADISSGCNISQGYLSRTFKSEFNMSVMDFVKLKKIQLVKLNLVFRQYSLSELAARTGFYDGGHMHRLFQQYEKKTIQEFKNKTQSTNNIGNETV